MNFYDLLLAKKLNGGGGGSLSNPKLTIKLVNNSGSNVDFQTELRIADGKIFNEAVEVENGKDVTIDVYVPYVQTNCVFHLPSEWASASSDDEVNCLNMGDGNIYIADSTQNASCTLELS